ARERRPEVDHGTSAVRPASGPPERQAPSTVSAPRGTATSWGAGCHRRLDRPWVRPRRGSPRQTSPPWPPEGVGVGLPTTYRRMSYSGVGGLGPGRGQRSSEWATCDFDHLRVDASPQGLADNDFRDRV